ncbi:MAG: fumarylacetoacetate hydrolase family protein [Nitrospinaceae bacterium]|jgi:acylpyruvate hydrolase|nr:fumarylacetoacetate hydrolase family protein [Nitrospinaceae bacterium]MBT3435935.1 fumarylacetoacetate hydrolase family protein [Nitrospinaceae bacterium]MBT3820996.1 fumarylacetoacetate hydrolase family protein [Nitrospinaceae bacterium]MBT4094765.1 fumarylacetoacetate hydrolase family protein [Nitrospinaceae bacterium]MBT4432052.1 fumarylacetoacetate hydrolase family protein [Nitrospinaceae bacterium]
MKLATYRNSAPGATGNRLGAVLSNGNMLDLRLAYAGYLDREQAEGRPYVIANARVPRDMTEFLTGGERALEAARVVVNYAEEEYKSGGEPTGPAGERCALKPKNFHLCAVIPKPGKFLHTGLNSKKHVENTGNKAPENVAGAPRFNASLIGHEEQVIHPEQTQKLDYEVEVGIVIGKRCKDVKPEDAFDAIVGYTIYNDITAREVQRSAALGGVFLGKNFDTTNPIGPYLVTADEVPNPNELLVECRVNGDVRQHERLTDMIFDIPALVAFFSQMTLEPGDIISSGTFGGVAHEQEDPEPYFLKPGHVVECEVEHLGILRNPIVAP